MFNKHIFNKHVSNKHVFNLTTMIFPARITIMMFICLNSACMQIPFFSSSTPMNKRTDEIPGIEIHRKGLVLSNAMPDCSMADHRVLLWSCVNKVSAESLSCRPEPRWDFPLVLWHLYLGSFLFTFVPFFSIYILLEIRFFRVFFICFCSFFFQSKFFWNFFFFDFFSPPK